MASHITMNNTHIWEPYNRFGSILAQSSSFIELYLGSIGMDIVISMGESLQDYS